MNLHVMKDRIETMPKHYQIEIGKILIKQYECTHNENQNGIFINLSNYNSSMFFIYRNKFNSNNVIPTFIFSISTTN